MAIDQDTLNVLNRIEKILSDSNRSTGGMGGGATRSGNTSRYDSGAARAEESQLQHTKKITVSTGKAVDRLGFASQNAATRLEDFHRKTSIAGTGLGNLSGAINKSIAQIGAKSLDLGKIDMSTTLSALQTAVESAATSIKTNSLSKGDTTGFIKSIGTLDDLIDNKVNPRLGSFNSALHLASSSLIGLWGDLREQRRDGGKEMKDFAEGIGKASSALSRKKGVGEYFETFIIQLRKANVALRELRAGAGNSKPREERDGDGSGAHIGNRQRNNSNSTDESNTRKSLTSTIVDGFKETARFAFAAAAARMITSGVEIVNQMFQTTGARGFGVFTETFFSLSRDAALAGMSLKEYAQMMDKNEGVISRFSSFAAFDKQLDVGREGLKKFGVFGQEATNLSAAMVGSAQTLGIPVGDLTKSMNGQMKVFEELRKTTGITADQFAEMNRNLQNNDDVQRELIGLAPEERAARLTQLQETSAMGRALGLTEQNANKLTAAMLAQRKSTVKERFNSAGRLRQSMSLVGMDPAEIAEAAALAGKRMKTPEEDARYNDLLGKYASRAEEIKANAGPGMANAVETSEENLTPQVRASMEAAVAVKAAKESGKQVTSDMGKALHVTEQWLGKIFGIMEGIGKSSIAQLAIGGLGLAASAALVYAQSVGTVAQVANTTAQSANTASLLTLPQRIALAIRSSMSGAGGANSADGLGGPDGKKDEGKGKGKGRFGRMAGNMKGIAGGSIVGSAIGVGFAAVDYSNAEENAKVENGGDGDVGKVKSEAIGTGIGSIAGGIIGAAIGSVIPGIGTVIVGTLGSMLGGFVGKMIGGFVGSENATEKNAKETAKLSKEMIEARRATAGTDVISTGNLSSLPSNLLQTGKAFAANTVEQEKAIQATVNKKNGTGQTAKGDTESSAVSNTTYDAMGNVTGSETVANDRIKSTAVTSVSPAPTEKAAPAPIQATPAPTEKATPAPIQATPAPTEKATPALIQATSIQATPVKNASLLSSALADNEEYVPARPIVPEPTPVPTIQPIATPVSITPTNVNQGTVNTATAAATAAEAASTTLTTTSVLPINDQATTLIEILKILQQSLMAENTQVDLVSQLLRSPAFATRLMDTNVLMDRAIRSA